LRDSRYTVSGRVKALGDAFRGLKFVFREEPNSIPYAALTACIIGLGFYREIDRHGWEILFLAGGLLWGLEAINSAVERLADAVTLEHDPMIGKAKDIAAGAVQIGAAFALVAVVLVFI
jgi:diacylglycerol kinase